jgi:hypothetical protein
MKSHLLAAFAVLCPLAGAAAVVTPVHAAVFTGFAHSDNTVTTAANKARACGACVLVGGRMR